MSDVNEATIFNPIAPPDKKPRGNSIQATLDTFDPVLEKLEKLAAELQEMGDRITGGRPRNAEKDPKVGGTSLSLITGVRARRDRMSAATDMIERELRVLSEGLWG